MRLSVLPLALVLCASAPLQASIFTLGSASYNVQFTTDSGAITDPATADHALLALDFGPSNVYLFGYEWQSGAKSGYDMLSDIAANSGGALTYTAENFGTTDAPEEFVGSLGYAGIATNDNYDDVNYSSWQYYISDNGAAFTSPDFGASDRVLLNGSIDDWTLLTVAPTPPDYDPTRAPTPLAQVPEPASLGILSLAAGGLLLRRRRSHGSTEFIAAQGAA